jgi:TRAP-type C4-dicarboxylate transport system permease small subunit
MAGLHSFVDRIVTFLENIGAVIAGVVLLICMVLVSLDAILRYGLAMPLTFQLHLTQYYLLVMLTMLGLSWGYRTGGAIQIAFLVRALPPRLGSIVIRIGLFAAAIYLMFLTWQAWHVFDRAWTRGSVVMGVIDWPVAWSWIWVPIGCGLLVARLLLDATSSTLRPIGAHHS